MDLLLGITFFSVAVDDPNFAHEISETGIPTSPYLAFLNDSGKLSVTSSSLLLIHSEGLVLLLRLTFHLFKCLHGLGKHKNPLGHVSCPLPFSSQALAPSFNASHS